MNKKFQHLYKQYMNVSLSIQYMFQRGEVIQSVFVLKNALPHKHFANLCAGCSTMTGGLAIDKVH